MRPFAVRVGYKKDTDYYLAFADSTDEAITQVGKMLGYPDDANISSWETEVEKGEIYFICSIPANEDDWDK